MKATSWSALDSELNSWPPTKDWSPTLVCKIRELPAIWTLWFRPYLWPLKFASTSFPTNMTLKCMEAKNIAFRINSRSCSPICSYPEIVLCQRKTWQKVSIGPQIKASNSRMFKNFVAFYLTPLISRLGCELRQPQNRKNKKMHPYLWTPQWWAHFTKEFHKVSASVSSVEMSRSDRTVSKIFLYP